MEPNRSRLRRPTSRGRSREPRIRDLWPAILNGCCTEACRAEIVGAKLQGLRRALVEHLHPPLTAIIVQLPRTSKLLRDLADRSQVHLSQAPVMIEYLNIILPCLSRTLRDVTKYYEDTTKNSEHRWRAMYHDMSNEHPGTALPARFVMYNEFLEFLVLMLKRNPNFDINAIEILRARILELREVRGIDPPTLIRTDLVRREKALDFWNRENNTHWAETIFTRPLPSRRVFKAPAQSHLWGPLQKMGYIEPIPGIFKTLIKRSFDHDRISVVISLRANDHEPYMLVRLRAYSVNNNSEENWFDIRPVHHLSFKRESPSVIHLSCLGQPGFPFRPWAKLSFRTWEELVLFHCTLASLKQQTNAPMARHELFVRGEEIIFQAPIHDDGFVHNLTLSTDKETGGCRLQAMAMSEESLLYTCPVWTAFIPPDFLETWLIPKSPRRIWLRHIHVYSFSEDYDPYKQYQEKYGTFELKFVRAQAAAKFLEHFVPVSSGDEASEGHRIDDPTPTNED